LIRYLKYVFGQLVFVIVLVFFVYCNSSGGPSGGSVAQYVFSANQKISDFSNVSTPFSNQRGIVYSSGSLYVIWNDDRVGNYDVYFDKGTIGQDGTVSWGTDVRVDDDTGASSQVAVSIEKGTNSGEVFAAWTDYRNGDPDIFFSKSTDGGMTWSGSVKVSDDTGTAIQTKPAITVDESDNIFIIWADYRNGDMDIYLSFSRDGGSSWSASVKVNDDTGQADQNLGAITASNGYVHIFYRDKRNNVDQISYTRGVLSGTTFVSENSKQIVTLPPTGTTIGGISVDSCGSKILVAWNDDRGGTQNIYYILSKDNGDTWGSVEDIVATETNNDRQDPYVRFDSNCRVFVTWWEDGRDPGDIVFSWSPDFVNWMKPVIVNDDQVGNFQDYGTLDVDDNGKVYIVWEDERSINNRDVYFSVGIPR